MRLSGIFLTSAIVLTAFGCGGSGTETPSTPANVANSGNIEANATNSQPVNTGGELETKKTPPVATTNEAPTLSPVVKAYCEAIIKKDDATLRRIHSQETLKILETDMKSDGITSLAAFLAELDPIKDVSKCGARNETIEGNSGVAEIRNENMPGLRVKFVKENGEWKITNQSPDDPKK